MRFLGCGIMVLGFAACVTSSGNVQPAVSDGAELIDLSIHRRKAAYAEADTDLVSMKLALWFPFDGPDQAKDLFYLRLVELDPIRDDAGKVVTTRKRFRGLDDWTQEIRASTLFYRAGRGGPLLELTLDAPARSATRLKLVKGKVEVRQVRIERLAVNPFQPVAFKSFLFEFKGVELP